MSQVASTPNVNERRRLLRSLVDDHRLLHHEFFRLIVEDARRRELLLRWAIQDRHVSYHFPRLIAQIVASLPCDSDREVRARMPLVRNLWEELGEGNPRFCHSALMEALIESLEGGAEARATIEVGSSIRRFIDLQMAAARKRSRG